MNVERMIEIHEEWKKYKTEHSVEENSVLRKESIKRFGVDDVMSMIMTHHLVVSDLCDELLNR